MEFSISVGPRPSTFPHTAHTFEPSAPANKVLHKKLMTAMVNGHGKQWKIYYEQVEKQQLTKHY